MTTIEFRHAVGRLYFECGRTDDGKMIRKTKTYRNLAKGATAENLYDTLLVVALLSDYPFIGAEKVETADIMKNEKGIVENGKNFKIELCNSRRKTDIAHRG